MNAEELAEFETVEIAPGSVVGLSYFRYVESPWMVCVDGVTQRACEINRETGEVRGYDYSEAVEEILA